MSSKLSAAPSTAQTAITRMSISRCSTLQGSRGSETVSSCSISAWIIVRLPRWGRRTYQPGQPADFMRRPWVLARPQALAGQRPVDRLGAARLVHGGEGRHRVRDQVRAVVLAGLAQVHDPNAI